MLKRGVTRGVRRPRPVEGPFEKESNKTIKQQENEKCHQESSPRNGLKA